MKRTRNTTSKTLLAGVLAGLLALTGGVIESRASEKVLYNFEGREQAAEWGALNDNVMGGVSKGGARFGGNGTMLFAGTLSLENRGGFSSIRTGRKRVDLSAYDALAARVRGDGRTYWMTVNTNARIPAGSYRVTFRTEPGKWQVIRAPFSRFRATSFGRELPVFLPLNRSKVESIGFLIADKKAGPFRLEVDWVKAEAKAEAKACTKTSVAGPAETTGPKGEAQPKDIIDTAVGAGSFKTLVAAVKAAGLAETLKGKGPFTVFAPTDEAFAKLPKGTVQSLLKPENKAKLTAILTYHVAAGRTEIGRQTFKSLQGSPLNVASGDYLVVNGVKVVTPNIAASNGVIHVIDRVLLPDLPEPTSADLAKSLIELAISRGVPLFNRGRHASCAAIYEVVVQALLNMKGPVPARAERQVLRKALADVADSDDARANAWTLRRAMDRAYRGLSAD